MGLSNAFTVGLVGNPNSGKTTVFNALTGARQRVGNWPGVTVERKSGGFQWQDVNVTAVDLPGIYSLNVVSQTASIDEKITCEYILSQEANLIINVLDASNLERNLYLTLQLLEMQVPMIIAVNMMDVARGQGVQIDLGALEQQLGCQVVPLSANKKQGIEQLKQAIVTFAAKTMPAQTMPQHFGLMPAMLQEAVRAIMQPLLDKMTSPQAAWVALRLLEDDVHARELVSPAEGIMATEWQAKIALELAEDADILSADARYRFIQTVLTHASTQVVGARQSWTKRIDDWVLHRVLGVPIFLAVMYCMFLFAINIGGALQDFFDISSNTLFVEGAAHLLMQWHAPNWLIALIANGVGKGINTTVTFIPVIGGMFLVLALLEDSGYMARAAFVIDRLMRAMGLPGKAFVPMIVGFGCNVPAIMAARTLENQRDRILTVMMSPFMSCSARLAIYAVFTAAFFPVGGQNVVFMLYLIGIGMAMLTGLMLRKTLLTGQPAPLVLELPPYHLPNFKTVLLQAWQRLKGFLFRAGKLIVPICVLMGVLNVLSPDGTLRADGDSQSLLAVLGQFLTPIFSPMGIAQNNWPATVGLISGVLAKEVVVGTLNSLYSNVGHLVNAPAAVWHFWANLHAAVLSIPTNLAQLGQSLGNPVAASAPAHEVTQGVYGQMAARFDGRVGAMAYLLFVLLYFPCISTTAVMVRELNRAWAVFSILWSTGVAYCVAVAFYQLGTLGRHPLSSTFWVMAMIAVLGGTVVLVRLYAKYWQTGRGLVALRG
jgi:ferrous iron transport protein B